MRSQARRRESIPDETRSYLNVSGPWYSWPRDSPTFPDGGQSIHFVPMATPQVPRLARDDPPTRERVALLLLQVGVVAIVLAALPYKSFDLDRFFVVKELVLHVSAMLAALLCLGGRRQLSLSPVDLLLVGFLVVSGVSAAFAQNGWVATRALSMSISGALLFWTAASLRHAGLHTRLMSAIAAAVVIGALTALIQAYAGATTEYFSLNRAPGGWRRAAPPDSCAGPSAR